MVSTLSGKLIVTEETFKLVRDGIDVARACQIVDLEEYWERKVKIEPVKLINANVTRSQLNIVIFHVKIPDEVSKIDSPDIRGRRSWCC